jgi:hypothetical protein
MSVSQSIPGRDTPTGPAADAARVEQAIATVLQAEQAARLAIEAAARDAEAEHIAAREAARRIAERAARRSARVHDAIARRIERELAQSSAALAALDAAPAAAGLDGAQLAHVDALARALALGLD